jgi:hypothetical protein
VVVALPADRDAVPGVLLDLDPGSRRRGRRIEEVVREGQRVVLRRADTVFLGEREGGVLLGVGGQHRALVPGDVGGREVPAQGGRDVEVADLVAVGVAVDPHDAVLRFAVLVGAQDDAHVWLGFSRFVGRRVARQRTSAASGNVVGFLLKVGMPCARARRMASR